MKYLKLYEAFDANVLNSLNSFLKSKVSKSSMKRFTKDLEKLGLYADFKINELSKNDIEYLKYDDALKVKGTTSKISCVKYWFSAEKGYIGYTGTSNKIIEIDKGGRKKLEYIPDDLLKRLSEDTNLTGRLVKCDISEYRTGDYVSVYCGDNYNGMIDYSGLCIARIFVSGSTLYAIQNKKSGNSPGGDDWRQYGQHAWSLGNINGSFANDHCVLRKLIIDTDVDGFIYTDKVDDAPVIGDDVDPFLYNLQLDPNFNQLAWSEYNDESYDDDENGYYDDDDNWISTSNRESFKDNIKNNANYAIIVYLDRVTNKNSVKSLISKRVDDRSGAIAFLSDEQFKKINLDRYITKLFDRFNIKPTSNDNMSNLNQFIITLLGGEYVMVNYLIQGNSSSGYLSNAVNYLHDIINTENPIYYNALKSLYFDRRKEYMNGKVLDISSGGDAIKEIYDIYMDVGKMIVEHLKKHDIKDVYEFSGFYYKINTIFSMHNDGRLYDSNVGRYFRTHEFRSGNFVEFTGSESCVEKARNFKKAAGAILK